MSKPTEKSVDVTIITNASGQPCVQASPTQLDLSGTTGAVKIKWTLKTSGYRFLTQTENSTYGIDISGSTAGTNFTGWNPNHGRSPTEVDCTDPNTDGTVYTYTITVKNTSTGTTVTSDPTIKDNN